MSKYHEIFLFSSFSLPLIMEGGNFSLPELKEKKLFCLFTNLRQTEAAVYVCTEGK